MQLLPENYKSVTSVLYFGSLVSCLCVCVFSFTFDEVADDFHLCLITFLPLSLFRPRPFPSAVLCAYLRLCFCLLFSVRVFLTAACLLLSACP